MAPPQKNPFELLVEAIQSDPAATEELRSAARACLAGNRDYNGWLAQSKRKAGDQPGDSGRRWEAAGKPPRRLELLWDTSVLYEQIERLGELRPSSDIELITLFQRLTAMYTTRVTEFDRWVEEQATSASAIAEVRTAAQDCINAIRERAESNATDSLEVVFDASNLRVALVSRMRVAQLSASELVSELARIAKVYRSRAAPTA